MLRQHSSIPLYEQLAARLKAEILSGSRPSGERLPPEKTLADACGVSLITVRQAMAKLAEEGLVIRKQGKGTFVRAPKYTRDYTRIMSFSESCAANGHKAGAQPLRREWIDPDDRVADRLLISPLERCIFVERLRTVDGAPMAIESNTFPASFAFLLEADLTGSLFDLLRHSGTVIADSRKTIEITRGTAAQEKLLGVPRGTPLLLVQSVALDASGLPVYLGTQRIHGERFTLHI